MELTNFFIQNYRDKVYTPFELNEHNEKLSKTNPLLLKYFKLLCNTFQKYTSEDYDLYDIYQDSFIDYDNEIDTTNKIPISILDTMKYFYGISSDKSQKQLSLLKEKKRIIVELKKLGINNFYSLLIALRGFYLKEVYKSLLNEKIEIDKFIIDNDTFFDNNGIFSFLKLYPKISLVSESKGFKVPVFIFKNVYKIFLNKVYKDENIKKTHNEIMEFYELKLKKIFNNKDLDNIFDINYIHIPLNINLKELIFHYNKDKNNLQKNLKFNICNEWLLGNINKNFCFFDFNIKPNVLYNILSKSYPISTIINNFDYLMKNLILNYIDISYKRNGKLIRKDEFNFDNEDNLNLRKLKLKLSKRYQNYDYNDNIVTFENASFSGDAFIRKLTLFLICVDIFIGNDNIDNLEYIKRTFKVIPGSLSIDIDIVTPSTLKFHLLFKDFIIYFILFFELVDINIYNHYNERSSYYGNFINENLEYLGIKIIKENLEYLGIKNNDNISKKYIGYCDLARKFLTKYIYNVDRFYQTINEFNIQSKKSDIYNEKDFILSLDIDYLFTLNNISECKDPRFKDVFNKIGNIHKEFYKAEIIKYKESGVLPYFIPQI